MQELKRQRLTSYVGKQKQGPQKCPDFFCVDPAGLYHLIECKGNQGGPEQSENQFVRGKQQKANVSFTNEQRVGQRPVTGLAIANPSSNWQTQLTVSDPPPTRQVEVNVENPEKVLTALNQVVALDGLLLSGCFARARKILPEAERVKVVPDVADHSESKFESNGAVWQGRVFAIDFPIPIKTFEGEEITGVRFKFGVSPEFLKRSEDGPPDWKDLDLRIRRGDQVPGFRRRSFIEYGDSFVAEIELL